MQQKFNVVCFIATEITILENYILNQYCILIDLSEHMPDQSIWDLTSL